MLLIEIPHIKKLITVLGLKAFFKTLNKNLTQDFKDWQSFQKSSRHAVYVDNGVIELMPVCGKKLYSFKYVNGHPENIKLHKPTIYACGLLAEVASGEPLMISEMTLLTALRTAATSALASSYMARSDSKILSIIGCGAQSDFQVLAHHALFNLKEVRYFDLDPKAMQRFANNLQNETFKLVAGKDAQSIVSGADIIITATAAKKKQKVLNYSWLEPGQHICGIGGDSPGKTELDVNILKNSKIVVEYFPQTAHEGEIQNLGKNAKKHVYAELWELVSGKKKGRKNAKEITLFDSVGFALEDYSILRLIYDLAPKYQIGREVALVPDATNLPETKDLFKLIKPTPSSPNSVTILSYASGLAANNIDCGLGPLYLYQHQQELFRELSFPLKWHPAIIPTTPEQRSDIVRIVTAVNTALAEEVTATINSHEKFCVLAGDHASAIGTWSGAAHAYRKQGDIGLIWIDAHMDSHTPETTPTGNIHGMPVAHLFGYGIKSLKEILDKEPKLKPENICFIGIRSYEEGEASFLTKLGVKVFFMPDVQQQGLANIFKMALEHVNKHTFGFGLTIDLDAMDPTDAPGVGCPEKGGILSSDLLDTLNKAEVNYPFVGLEITEYNPIQDKNQKTAKLVASLLEAVYGKHSHFIKD